VGVGVGIWECSSVGVQDCEGVEVQDCEGVGDGQHAAAYMDNRSKAVSKKVARLGYIHRLPQ
jgi:hypothetical protein